jgi:hypothetical protein
VEQYRALGKEQCDEVCQFPLSTEEPGAVVAGERPRTRKRI